MCVFCSINQGDIPSYKIYENESVIAILDLSQATIGHTIVITKKHYDTFLSLDEEVYHDVLKACKEVCNILQDKLNVSSFNLINNCKEEAGQTVMHFHMHVIPRYNKNDLSIEPDKTRTLPNIEDIYQLITK